MIQAVIFDCFGVLASDGWLPFREKYFANEPDLLEKAIASNKRMDAGLHTYEDFIRDISYLSGVPFDQTRALIETNPPNDPLFDFIRDELKGRYKIGMLSNSGTNWLDKMFRPEQVALFDEVVLSYQINAIKPDAVMYQTIADKLDVLPQECLFIDDQPRYVTGAEDLGMQGVHFVDTQSAIERVRELLGA
jgi:HAD superfamily hydrolase (TIGR01509 family)